MENSEASQTLDSTSEGWDESAYDEEGASETSQAVDENSNDVEPAEDSDQTPETEGPDQTPETEDSNQTPEIEDSPKNSINVDPQTLEAISNMRPDYDEVHSTLVKNDQEYASLANLLSNDSALDSYLFENNEEYQQLTNKSDKDSFRNEVSSVLKTALSEKLQKAGEEYLSQQKQVLLNNVRLADFESYITSNETVKPLTELSDKIYHDLLSVKSLEDNDENRGFFNKAINSFIIDMSQVFGLNEKEFAHRLGKVLGGNQTQVKDNLNQFNERAKSLKKAQSKARSITGQGIDSETYLVEDDDSWSRFN